MGQECAQHVKLILPFPGPFFADMQLHYGSAVCGKLNVRISIQFYTVRNAFNFDDVFIVPEGPKFMQPVHTEVARRPPLHQGVGSLTWCDSTSCAVFEHSAHDAAAVLRI